MPGAPKLRLKEVLVQPVFVLDDGETLSDVGYGQDEHGNPTTTHHPIITVPAREWPAYSGERFPVEVRAFQKKLDAEYAARTAAQAGNRAQRRAAARKSKPPAQEV